MTDKAVTNNEILSAHLDILTCHSLQGPTAVTATPNGKLAMSRALGAAFLSHQVEQLEKSVTNRAGVGNWRDRRQSQANNPGPIVHGTNERGTKRSPHAQSGKPIKKKGGEAEENEREKNGLRLGRRSTEEPKKGEKDADVIVVDSSVLVNALYQVKKWCKEGREEILIIPLEGECITERFFVSTS